MSSPPSIVKVLPLVFKIEDTPENSIDEIVISVFKSSVVSTSNIPVSLSAKVVPPAPNPKVTVPPLDNIPPLNTLTGPFSVKLASPELRPFSPG